MRVGVDFGTTRTVVACADRGNYPVLSFVDKTGDTQEWFPSVVAELGGELFFGFEAQALALRDDACVLRSFKRLLGNPGSAPGSTVRIGPLTVRLDQLVIDFLRAVHEAIRTRSNLAADQLIDEGEPLRTVIGVPAHAGNAQRFVTLDAFRRAGFSPVAMLNEPSAAGFEFTHRHRANLSSRRDHVVVYDMGGGTFDTSLVRMRAHHHEVLASAGVNRLGGDDFDQVLLDLVLDRAKLESAKLSASSQVIERLLEQCREAKERLSPSSRKLSIDLDGIVERSSGASEVTIAAQDYYDACAPLIERSIETVIPVMARFNDIDGVAAADGGIGTPSNIAGLYVVGGASSLPVVPRMLRARFGRRVHRSPYPSAAVAIGLAIACDEASGFELSDQYARTFGVFREGAAGTEITFDPIFTSDTRVPAPGAPIKYRRAYRAAHNVGHFRFLECSGLGADGQPSGDAVSSGDVLFPFEPALCETALDLAAVQVQRMHNQGPRIEEEYTLDEHGIVAVTIRNLDSGYQRVYQVGGV